MILRNLVILLAIIAAFWIIRSLLSRRPSTGRTRMKDQRKDMVQCELCKIYLPADDAIQSDNKNFCSQKHLEEWKYRDS